METTAKRFFVKYDDSVAAPHVNFNRFSVDSYIVTMEDLTVIHASCKISSKLKSSYTPNCKVGEKLPAHYAKYEVSKEVFNENKTED